MFNYLLDSTEENYTAVQILKDGPRGTIRLLRHNGTGKRFVFREYPGSGEVYRKLLPVRCPYLPEVYETAERDGRVLVLEEYIAGDNLAWLLEKSLCTPREARDIVRQLCQGVWTLHAMGAVHRDIKPDNVILRGSDAVLIDFDASRLYKPERTADTQVLGTAGFAAPEQYGIAQTDTRADIYSMGVLLNVLLTGEHPSRRMAKGHLGRVVERCTMTDPGKRYQSVLHLMEALW